MATLATHRIVRHNVFFVNCTTRDVIVGPTIEFGSVEGDSLLANGELFDIGTYCLIEDSTAHP